MNLIIQSWEKYTVKRSKNLVFSCDDLRENFEELESLTDEEIVNFFEKTNGYVAGTHLKDTYIQLSESENDEDIGIEDSGTEICLAQS